MLAYFKTVLTDLVDLVYPRTCAGCNDNAPVRQGIFCIDCLSELPETGYHEMPDNPFERHFWGRVPVVAGAAFLFFVPGGRTQRLLYNIKYRDQQQYAIEIGKFYGNKLARCPRFREIDCIIPVPLHWKRERKRGFNQSAAFSKGLAESMQLKLQPALLRRTRRTKTQTRKSRADRIENMRAAFVIKNGQALVDCHILLVDDVLTTGATLEACAEVLLDIPGTRVSMVTIACGRI